MPRPDARGSSKPALLGLFHNPLPGPEALLEVARRRFERSGLGTEYNADSPGDLAHRMAYAPAGDRPATVHLSRRLNLFRPEDRAEILEFARHFAPRLLGLVIHDQPEAAESPGEVARLLEEIDRELAGIEGGPMLFVEYAVFLPPELFVELFERIQGLERVSACTDVGHLGLARVRHLFALEHGGDDVCRYTSRHPSVPALMGEIDRTVHQALASVCQVIDMLAALGKPLHFHLHDGHPLSTVSPVGVSDHVSFLERLPIPFEHEGKRELDFMFGPEGLRAIVKESLSRLPPEKLSFTLEIHPPPGRAPLEEQAELFTTTADLERAERMNHWMDVLEANQALLEQACAAAITTRG